MYQSSKLICLGFFPDLELQPPIIIVSDIVILYRVKQYWNLSTSRIYDIIPLSLVPVVWYCHYCNTIPLPANSISWTQSRINRFELTDNFTFNIKQNQRSPQNRPFEQNNEPKDVQIFIKTEQETKVVQIFNKCSVNEAIRQSGFIYKPESVSITMARSGKTPFTVENPNASLHKF